MVVPVVISAPDDLNTSYDYVVFIDKTLYSPSAPLHTDRVSGKPDVVLVGLPPPQAFPRKSCFVPIRSRSNILGERRERWEGKREERGNPVSNICEVCRKFVNRFREREWRVFLKTKHAFHQLKVF